MAATPSLKVIKSFTYRGTTRQFSNRYHLAGGTPADGAHWTTLSDNVVTAEKAVYTSAVQIVKTIGYAAGSDIPIFTKTYSTAGTYNPGTWAVMPGDCAALIRYATAARSSKNHPVYLYNYYHGVVTSTAGGDSILAGQVTLFSAYAALWIGAGFSDGSTSYNRAGPNGATATGYLVEPYITHRDLPR